MATRAEIAATVADMLARADLATQINAEIARAVEHYNRSGGYVFTEEQEGEIATVSGQEWYETVEFPGFGTVATTAISDIDHMRAENGWSLGWLSIRSYEDVRGNPSITGYPTHFTRYGGKLGFWPVPNGAFTITLAARVQPTVPTDDDGTSIWFSRAREAVEARVAGAVALKYLQDAERAQMFAVIRQSAEAALAMETANQTTTGRLRPTRF